MTNNLILKDTEFAKRKCDLSMQLHTDDDILEGGEWTII